MAQWGEKQRAEENVTCSLVGKPDIYLELMARQKITLLMNEYKHNEWLAYLLGRISEQKNFFVEDIVVPPHKESMYASAEAEPFNIPANCIGVIHSHHTMGAFHSGTDQTHVDRNFPMSITVAESNGNLTWDAVSIQNTPCGKPLALKCDIKYIQPEPAFDEKEWLEAAKKNIDKGQTVYAYKGYQGCLGYDAEDITPSTKEIVVPNLSGWNENVKGILTVKAINRIRDKIQDRHGVILTRSEIEDACGNLSLDSTLLGV